MIFSPPQREYKRETPRNTVQYRKILFSQKKIELLCELLCELLRELL